MKRLLFFTLLLGAMLAGTLVNAQVVTFKTVYSATTGYTNDTMRNSETSYLYTPPNALNGSAFANGGYVIQYTATNDSATTSLNATLQCSLDGVNWTNYFMSDTGTNGIHCDVKAISGTTTHRWDCRPGATQTVIVNGTTYYYKRSNATRTLVFRIKQDHANGGKTHGSATLIPQAVGTND